MYFFFCKPSVNIFNSNVLNRPIHVNKYKINDADWIYQNDFYLYSKKGVWFLRSKVIYISFMILVENNTFIK